jgi:uncharacterized membrane protein YkoI
MSTLQVRWTWLAALALAPSLLGGGALATDVAAAVDEACDGGATADDGDDAEDADEAGDIDQTDDAEGGDEADDIGETEDDADEEGDVDEVDGPEDDGADGGENAGEDERDTEGTEGQSRTLDDGEELLPQAEISLGKAIDAAQGAASGEVGEVDLECVDGALVFNVDVGDKDVKVDATTGEVLSADADD